MVRIIKMSESGLISGRSDSRLARALFHETKSGQELVIRPDSVRASIPHSDLQLELFYPPN